MSFVCRRLVSRVFAAALLVLCLAPVVHASNGVRFEDSNKDGVYDVALFDRDGVGFKVFDNDGDMSVDGGVEACCDKDSDTWVLSRGNESVIVMFRNDSNNITASFFEDIDGDGIVSYKPTKRGVVADEGNPQLVFHLYGKSWNEHGALPDMDVFIYSDYLLEESENTSFIRLLPGIASMAPQAVLSLYRNKTAACDYVQYLDNIVHGKQSPLTKGCLKFNVSELWPVFGRPLHFEADELCVGKLELFVSTGVDGQYSFNFYNGTLLPSMDKRLQYKDFREYFWSAPAPSGDSSSDGASTTGLSAGFYAVGVSNSEPPLATVKQAYYAIDTDDDGNLDYGVISTVQNSWSMRLDKPIPFLKDLCMPSKNFVSVLKDFYAGFSGITIFLVYAGDGLPPRPLSLGRDNFTSLSLAGSGEVAFTTPVFYRSVVDGRMHMTYTVGGFWLLDSNYSKGVVNFNNTGNDLLFEAYFNRSDYVRYSDTDGDGLVDLWRRVVDGSVVESLYAAEDTIIFVNESIFFKRYGTDHEVQLLQIPASLTEFRSLRKIPLSNRTDERKTLLEIFNSLPGAVLAANMALLTVKYSDHTAVADVYCEDNCQISNGSSVKKVGMGRYLIIYNGDYRFYKISSLLKDYVTRIDAFFNNKPSFLLITLLFLSTLIFFVLWEEY